MDLDKEKKRLEKKMARYERAEQKQIRLQAFVDEHNLACFKCGTRLNYWAAASTKGTHHWAICVPCVHKPPNVPDEVA